jgi:hypothetical protein
VTFKTVKCFKSLDDGVPVRSQHDDLENEIHSLGALAKLRKAAFSFVMSVRPSDRTEQLGFQW